jgi:predicted AAA+ superfamily ATPase
LDPREIVEKLSLYLGTEIRPEESLLVFDEIQECPEALSGLKFFQEEAPVYHVAAAGKKLFFWTSNATAEVDFVVEDGERIYPLEVTAGKSAKKKSLLVYGNKFTPPVLSRTTAMNFKLDGAIADYPLNGLSRFPMSETPKV